MNGNQTLSGNCVYKSITAKNIATKRINYIPVEKMYQKSKSPTVKNKKYFNSVSAINVQTKNFNEVFLKPKKNNWSLLTVFFSS